MKEWEKSGAKWREKEEKGRVGEKSEERVKRVTLSHRHACRERTAQYNIHSETIYNTRGAFMILYLHLHLPSRHEAILTSICHQRVILKSSFL